jgi:regulatory protein
VAAIPEAEDPLGRALALAYRQISRRERTVGEVRGHLLERGIESQVTDAAIAELREQGYLNDARFARVFAEDKRVLQQWGAERIRRGLEQRGINRELVDAALVAADDQGAENELERAVALLRSRFSHAPRDRRDRERALGVLVRRGYEHELAMDAIRAYCASVRVG